MRQIHTDQTRLSRYQMRKLELAVNGEFEVAPKNGLAMSLRVKQALADAHFGHRADAKLKKF